MAKTADKPLVTVLCITYNHEKYIAKTLDSFLEQKTNFPFEILVHDDASTDKTASIIKKYQEKYPEIIKPIFEKKNQYSQTGVKFVVDMWNKAQGKYLAQCEGDDYWTSPDKLQVQVDFLEQNKSFSACFHRARVIYEGSRKEQIYPEVDDEAWYTTEELLKINYIPANSIMYRKQQYSNIPSDIMPFDWYTHLYHAQFGPIKFIDKTMSVYRKHSNGIWSDYDQDRHKIWIAYGLPYMKLYDAIDKIFGKNKKYQKIIDESVNNLLQNLLATDQLSKTTLFNDAVKLYPERLHGFISYQHECINKNLDKIQKLTKDLLKVGDERNALRAELDNERQKISELTSELDQIVNSKTWRARTKVHNLTKKNRSS